MSINEKQLNKFLDAIKEDANIQAESLDSKTQSYINEELEIYKKQLTGNYSEYITREKANVKRAVIKKYSREKLEAKNRLYTKRNAIIDEVFEKAVKKLEEYKATDKYKAYLLSGIYAAKASFDGIECEISISRNDATYENDIKALAGAKCNVSLCDNISGGAIVFFPKISIVIDNSFEALLKDCREKFLMTKELKINL